MTLREPFRVPLFVVLVSVAMTLVGLGFSVGLFLRPAALLKGVDVTDPVLAGLAFSMGTRSLTMALALLIALALRSRSGLIAVLTMRALTESLDIVNMLGRPEASVVVPQIAVMILAELFAIGLLVRARPRSTTEPATTPDPPLFHSKA